MGSFSDISGKKFGMLQVIRRSENRITGKKPVVMWLCKCDCGKETVLSGWSLKSGHTVSCGCSKVKHGMANKERLYETWKNMKRRCNDQKNKRYKKYGGRGIKVCAEWEEYSAFRKWAIENGYKENLTLDRIDNDGNYCPENCRWADSVTQANNTSRNRYIEYNGEIMSMANWARKIGISYGTINHRVQRGWSMERIVNTPQR